MKKFITIFFILLSSKNLYSQNGLMVGFNTYYLSKSSFLYGPTLNYSLGIGEKWSFQFGFNYYHGTRKDILNLYNRTPTEPDGEAGMKIIYNYPDVNLDFKRYLKDGNLDDGGFYFRFGFSAALNTRKYKIDDYDTNIYYINQSYPPSSTVKRGGYIDVNFKTYVGFEKEIFDAGFLFIEGGGNFLSTAGQNISLHVGVRKMFIKL